MIAEILCVGTELLLGQITNTNARFLSQYLAELGIDVYYQQVVGDNRDRIAQALRLALGRSGLVVMSGGLGPTEDDLTKEVVSEVLGLRLRFDEAMARTIRGVLERHRSRGVDRAVEKQAMVPEGAVVLPNSVGTAPGLFITKGETHVVLLPGPPAELEAIASEPLRQRLETLTFVESPSLGPWPRDPAERALAGSTLAGPRSYLQSRVVKMTGVGEPAVEEAVRDLIHSVNPTVAPLVSLGETHLRVTAKAATREEALRLVDGKVEAIRQRLERHIFGYDDDTIASAAGDVMRRRGLRLAVAESLTGGLVGHLITQSPGASDYFERGLVVYSNQAKEELLGVDSGTLARVGAVSEEAARAMARGVRERSGVDIGLALTGIAGPAGGSADKPVGLVYIALDGRPRCGSGASGRKWDLCHRYVFGGPRPIVKHRAAHCALSLLWQVLRG